MRIAVVDTTFARVDMGRIVADEIKGNYADVAVERKTVPGIKDLPVACKRLLSEADICIACGMPGGMDKDRVCANQASTGIIQAQLMADKHIIEVFVHEDEADNPRELKNIVEDRCRKHALNAVHLLRNDGWLEKNAGKGLRQGSKNAGSI